MKLKLCIICIQFECMLLYILIFALTFSFLLTVLCTVACVHMLGLGNFVTKILAYFLSSPNADYDKQFSREGRVFNSECPICLQKIKQQVVATCGHSYCAGCIIDYWHHHQRKKIDCPACRTSICVLMRNFPASTQQSSKLKKQIISYNRAYSENSSFLRSLRQFVNMLPHIKSWILSREGLYYLLSNNRLRPLILSVLYLLSPIDLLPQIILGPLGLIDDGYVALNSISILTNLFINYVREQE